MSVWVGATGWLREEGLLMEVDAWDWRVGASRRQETMTMVVTITIRASPGQELKLHHGSY